MCKFSGFRKINQLDWNELVDLFSFNQFETYEIYFEFEFDFHFYIFLRDFVNTLQTSKQLDDIR